MATTTILALAVSASHAYAAPPQNTALPSENSPATTAPAERPNGLAPIRRALQEQRLRMIDLTNQLLKAAESPDHYQDERALQALRVDAAKADFNRAALTREAAELEVLEFEKRDIAQEEARNQEELGLARRYLELLRRRPPRADERRRLIEQASKGANVDVAPLYAADLEEKKIAFEIEKAESKFKLFAFYTQSGWLKKRKSAVEIRKSDEASKRAIWEREQAKFEQLQSIDKARAEAERGRRTRNPHEQLVLAALDQAIAIEGRIKASLDQPSKVGKSDDRPRHDVDGLLAELASVVDSAAMEESAAQFDRLVADFKSDAHPGALPSSSRAADDRQSGSIAPPSNSAKPSFSAQARWRLKTEEDRMVNLANQLRHRRDRTDAVQDQLLGLEIDVKSAAANFENAKLGREIAEIAIIEYDDGIFVQDRQTLEGERNLAQSDLSRQQDRFDLAKSVLAESKLRFKNSLRDTVAESELTDSVERERTGVRRAELALAEIESKIKVLDKCTRPKRHKELQALVEKARMTELAKRADWEQKQSTLKTLEGLIKARGFGTADNRAREEQDRKTRAALDRAIPICEQIERKLDQLSKTVNADNRLEGEIRDLLAQLDTLLDEAEYERTAAEFEMVKTRIHSAAK